jgi:hypothetical protein
MTPEFNPFASGGSVVECVAALSGACVLHTLGKYNLRMLVVEVLPRDVLDRELIAPTRESQSSHSRQS